MWWFAVGWVLLGFVWMALLWFGSWWFALLLVLVASSFGVVLWLRFTFTFAAWVLIWTLRIVCLWCF